MRWVRVLPPPTKPSTCSVVSVRQWIFPGLAEGWTPKMEPICSVFFCRICHQLKASFVRAYCFTRMLYLICNCWELRGMRTTGASWITSCDNCAEEAMITLEDLSPCQQ